MLGLGSHWLVAAPCSVHVYDCVVGPPTAASIEYPLAHVVPTVCVVEPINVATPVVNTSAVAVQLTAVESKCVRESEKVSEFE